MKSCPVLTSPCVRSSEFVARNRESGKGSGEGSSVSKAREAGVSRGLRLRSSQGHLPHKKSPHLGTLQVGLCPGPYGGPRGDAVLL
jgi:hypothetical protein